MGIWRDWFGVQVHSRLEMGILASFVYWKALKTRVRLKSSRKYVYIEGERRGPQTDPQEHKHFAVFALGFTF